VGPGGGHVAVADALLDGSEVVAVLGEVRSMSRARTRQHSIGRRPAPCGRGGSVGRDSWTAATERRQPPLERATQEVARLLGALDMSRRCLGLGAV
jgi:hypothetical protein